ncbi:MAG: PKD domain-containing protein [Phycisphaeraceae bacterium]|nr:PKD domain-containing protein [Phycisphaeraceae bacterium]
MFKPHDARSEEYMKYTPSVCRAVRSVRQLSAIESGSELSWRGLEMLEPRLLLSGSGLGFDYSTSSWLGGAGNDQEVRGAIIQSDGTVVLAANIGNAQPGGLTPDLLGSATGSSSGAIIRLSADGTQVLSVARLAGKVMDLAADSAGNLYVAMWTEGFAKLNPDATSVLWSKSTMDLGFANVQRIDAGPDGYVAVLGGGSLDAGTTLGGHVQVFDPTGIHLGGVSDSKWKNDVAIHEPSGTVVFLGYRNATDGASGLPVQISYYRGIAYDGTIKYTGYDWSGNPNSPDYLNSPTNNMADTRGYRAAIGDDGYLYLAFESAGGNNLFRYDPFDINTPVSLAGGDSFHSPFNTGANHITFFGKYEPATGEFVNGNHFLTRLTNGSGNTAFMRRGDIHADSEGRVYVVGQSAWGLPLPSHPSYSGSAGFNPGVDNNYLGGSFLLVMEPNLTTRAHISSLTGGMNHTVAARVLPGGSAQIVTGGRAGGDLYLLDPIQSQPGTGHNGWFAVIADSAPTPGNQAPTAAFSVTVVDTTLTEMTLRMDAGASSDPDDDTLRYLWNFGDGTSAEGLIVEHTFELGATRTITLTVLDGEGGWSHAQYRLGTPNASFNVSAFYGDAPVTVDFDASASSHLSQDPATLGYVWDFGDGNTGVGITPWHTYEEAGVYQVTLTVTDNLGLQSTTSRTIVVADPNAWNLRLDFQDFDQPFTTVAPGWTAAFLEEYDSERGFGYESIHSEYRVRQQSSHFSDLMLREAHLAGTSYQTHIPATFLVDVPNGTYRVVAYLTAANHGYTFLGIEAEGELRDKYRSVGSSSMYQSIFEVVVEDGQLTLDLHAQSGAGSHGRWEWSGLEIHQLSDQTQEAARLSGMPGGPAMMTGAAQTLAPGLLIAGDPAATLQHATVRIAQGYLSAEDVLTVQTQGNISADWDVRTGTLTLWGEDSAANYQAVLRSVQYDNVQATPSGGERVIEIQVHDGLVASNRTSLFLVPQHLASVTVVEDFENYTAGQPLHGSGSWTSQGAAAVVQDPSGADNLVGFVINRDTQSSNSDPGFLIDADEQATLFFRAYVGPNTGSGGNFGMGVAGTNQVNAGVFIGQGHVAIGPASNQVHHAPEAGAWYRIWIEIDNQQKRYSVYLQSDDDGYYAERRLLGSRNFQGGTVTGALDTFYVRYNNHPSQHFVHMDDFTMIRPVGDATSQLPIVEVVTTDALAHEGDALDTAEWTILRDGDTTGDLVVHYTIQTDTPASNYELLTATPGILVIPAGDPFAKLQIRAIDNDIADGLRAVTLQLQADSAYNLGTRIDSTVILVDDETPATVTVLATQPNTGEEGFPPGEVTFFRTGPTTYDMVVRYVLSGAATHGEDYTVSTPEVGTILIPAGQDSASMTITPINDALEEGFEWVIVTVDRLGPDYVIGGFNETRVVIFDSEVPLNYVLIDDFEDYHHQMPVRDSWTWLGDSNARVLHDPLDEGNLTLFSRDRTQRAGSIDDMIWIGDNQVGTMFFRMLVDQAASQATYIGFHAGTYTQTTVAGPIININGIEGQPYQLDTWYNVWVVADSSTNRYSVYMQSNDDPAYSEQQVVATDRPFRTGSGFANPMPLTMFNVSHANHPNFTSVFIDDLYFAAGDAHSIQPISPIYSMPVVTGVLRDDGQVTPATLESLRFTFNVDVPTITADALSLIDQTTGSPVDLSSGVVFSYDPVSFEATWDLAALGLGAGFYTAELDADLIVSATGYNLDGNGDGAPGGNFLLEDVLVALPGDANLDGVVDDSDLAIVQANLLMSGAGFTDGDFTGDGRVGLRDAFLLLEHHGQSVVPPEPEALMVGLGDADDGQASPPTELATSSDDSALVMGDESALSAGLSESEVVQTASSPVLMPVVNEESDSATSLAGTGDWSSDPIPGPIPDNAGALSPVPVFVRGAAGEVPGPSAGMPGALAGLLTSRPSGGVLASTPAGGLLGLWEDGEDDEDERLSL